MGPRNINSIPKSILQYLLLFLDGFKTLDKKGNGFISKEDWDKDLEKVMKFADIKFSKTDLGDMWKFMDSNGDGRIEHEEFLMGTDDVSVDFLERKFPWGKLIKLIIAAYEFCCALDSCGCGD